MTDDATKPGGEARGGSRFPWLKAVLIASLALNLLFIGGAAARYFAHGPQERISGISNMQMIPRRFFGDLDRTRRSELLSIFKGFRGEFREGRRKGREQMFRLADTLEAEPYDESAVKDAVSAFTLGGRELMQRGGDAALEFIGKLTPDERKLLAKHIRLRDTAGRKSRDRRSGDD